MPPATVCCTVVAASDAAVVAAAFISATTAFASYTFSRCRISFSKNALCLLNGLHRQGGMRLRSNYIQDRCSKHHQTAQQDEYRGS